MGIPLNTLIDWRYDGKGPATYKVGGRWFYDSDACDRWMADQRAESLRGDLPVADPAGTAAVGR